jgi:hypothetical protein
MVWEPLMVKIDLHRPFRCGFTDDVRSNGAIVFIGGITTESAE